MKYDLNSAPDRHNTNSYKWDEAGEAVPMWVADMDLLSAPPVTEALIKRAKHGIFGYNTIPESWYEAYIKWWKTRHGFEMKKDRLIFTTGVIPAISSTVRKFSSPAEKVVIQTPVYNIFFNSVINNGRRILENPLIYENGQYRMDLEDLEEKLKDPEASMMILCNPHNPVGKIWERETLEKVGKLCKKYGVTVISDEIHCDITAPQKSYIPFASVCDECRDISISCIAPTKAFNIAGLQTAAVYAENRTLYNRINRALNTDEAAEPNSFAVCAAEAAFNEGGEWLDEVREYIWENRRYTDMFIKKELKSIYLVPGDATYLLWLDCTKITDDTDALQKHLKDNAGVYLSKGSVYGANGKGFLRMNIACPKSQLEEALERMKRGIISFKG